MWISVFCNFRPNFLLEVHKSLFQPLFQFDGAKFKRMNIGVFAYFIGFYCFVLVARSACIIISPFYDIYYCRKLVLVDMRNLWHSWVSTENIDLSTHGHHTSILFLSHSFYLDGYDAQVHKGLLYFQVLLPINVYTCYLVPF